MKNLQVPLVRQVEGSNDCGPACASMILGYYGMETSIDDVKADIKPYEWGTVTPQLGRYFLKRGFRVEIVTMHPSLFKLGMNFEGSDDMKAHLSSLKPKMKPPYDPVAIEHFIGFVADGGILTPKVPTLGDIAAEIEKGRPVLVPLTHWFLHESAEPPRFSIHFNVVTGISDDCVSVNDPDWGNEFGGKHEIDANAFLYAVYTAAKGGIDDACIMKVGPT